MDTPRDCTHARPEASLPLIRLSPRHGDLTIDSQDLRPRGGVLPTARPASAREMRRALARLARKGGRR